MNVRALRKFLDMEGIEPDHEILLVVEVRGIGRVTVALDEATVTNAIPPGCRECGRRPDGGASDHSVELRGTTARAW